MKYFNDDIIINLTRYITIKDYNKLSLCSSSIKKVFDDNKKIIFKNIINNIDNCNLIEGDKYYIIRFTKNNNTFVSQIPDNVCLIDHIKYFFMKYKLK